MDVWVSALFGGAAFIITLMNDMNKKEPLDGTRFEQILDKKSYRMVFNEP